MEKELSYELKRSRRGRRMRLTVSIDGKVSITSPFVIHESEIQNFFINKKKWVEEKVNFFKQRNPEGKILRKFTRKDYLKNKGKALLLVRECLEVYNKIYNLSFNRVSIKNQKSRWGSCSRRGNLNFNYKIVFLPPKLQDYIIVHELCHLKEMNHGRRFWALIERVFPDYLEIKKELRNYLL